MGDWAYIALFGYFSGKKYLTIGRKKSNIVLIVKN